MSAVAAGITGAAVRPIAYPDQAVGTNWLATVPGYADWEVLAFSVVLTTSGAVADRLVRLVADDGVNVFYAAISPYVQTAGQQFAYRFHRGVGENVNDTVSTQRVISLPLTYAFAGWRLRTDVAGLQGGDQLTGPRLVVLEREPQVGRADEPERLLVDPLVAELALGG